MSALFFGGLPLNVVTLMAENRFEVYATADIVSEYKDVYSRFEKKLGENQNHFFDNLLCYFKIISDFPKYEGCRDKDDDKFLSCAVNGAAAFIISGDKDLLSIKDFQGVEIISVADFLKLFER